jgi:hypothetical protein
MPSPLPDDDGLPWGQFMGYWPPTRQARVRSAERAPSPPP